MKTHENLDVWKKSINLVTDIYTISKCFPKEETYGLKSQIRRAAISVPSNIAVGAARQTNKEFIQFLYIALGSLKELETQLLIAYKLNFITEKKYEDVCQPVEEVGKMLSGLISYRKSKP
ncbi:four helix bundle protein [Haloflavibacter putidus]|uniref:Four helix bundle protein n=1 Tax=Haloflavibacter putidus TaxID=2576776 RepID=A0A507Z7Q0_9FLAO|nr:four helix bundle protein [Haloflavibacter putidus]TQD33490.1 four helix bundle protein [Haloflavibacter putidus]